MLILKGDLLKEIINPAEVISAVGSYGRHHHPPVIDNSPGAAEAVLKFL